MEIIFIIAGTIISYVILYFVIKAAVREGIIEARYTNPSSDDKTDDGTTISQTTCPHCKTQHDMDYPKCPNCKHLY